MLNTETIKNLLVAAVPEVLATNSFSGRNQVIGASEIGLCARLTVHKKLNETPIDADGAGRMLRGTALENGCVQIVREAFPVGAVKATGRNQMDLRHESLPLVCHPDGIITLAGSNYTLEIKTADSNAFRAYQKNGIKVWYEDQVTVAAALANTPAGTLLIMFDAGNLANCFPVHVPFNSARYASLEERARRIALHVLEETLPEGEPERSWGCSKCPIRQDCDAFRTRIAEAKAEGPDPVLVADLTAMLDEIKHLEDKTSDDLDEIEALKKQLKESLANNGLTEFKAGPYRATLTESSRATFDSAAFKKHNPEAFAQFTKTTTSATLRLNWGE